MNFKNQAPGRRLALMAPALLLVGACGQEPAAPLATTAAPATITVELGQAERVEVPQVIEFLGSVEAEKTAAVSSRVMAMVTAVRVQTGDRVGKGQRLLDIDPQATQGQLSQAKGALAQARAGLALAARNYERFKALTAAHAASDLELDMARTQYDQASGAVEQAEGGVAAASALAADSRVVAPFPGRVVRKMVEVGDLAAPGRPLLLLESEGNRRLALAVPEGLMARTGLAIGASLAIRFDARPDLGPVEAAIVEMTPGADPASHSFEVKAALPLDEIPTGTAGRARVEIDRRTIVAIPETAVLRRGGLSLVVVRDAEGHAISRVVTLGESLAPNRIEVLSGLAGNETVVLGLSSVPPANAYLQGIEKAEGQGS